MNVKIPGKILSEPFLIGVLSLVGMLSLYEDAARPGRPCPFARSDAPDVHHKIMDGTSRQQHISSCLLSTRDMDDKLLKACRLTLIPNRRTADRRLRVLPVGDMMNNMGNLHVSEKPVDDASASAGSSMPKADCPVWHRPETRNNHLPTSGTDADARRGFPKPKSPWVFVYRLDMSCSTGKPAIPLPAYVSTANVSGGKTYCGIAEPPADYLPRMFYVIRHA